MKTLGILFLLMFAAILTPIKGYSNPQALSMVTIENHSEKMYVESSQLYFSDEGIFLKTRSGEWIPTDHICYDAQGYYVTIRVLPNDLETYEKAIGTANYISEHNLEMRTGLGIYTSQSNGSEFYSCGADIIECGSRVSPSPKKWKCPYCNQWWLMGEECRNEDCPTNQWKKE